MRPPGPKLYSVGDIVFARQAICSNATRGQVDKLTYPFTGPWQIIARLHGVSYKIKHCSTKAKEKKHASNLSPYPVDLIPFRPLDGADNQFGQLYRKFKEHPYKEAGIMGFTPPTPFVVPTQFLTTSDSLSFKWPTLAKLNNELYPNFGVVTKDDAHDLGNSIAVALGFYTGPPPFGPLRSISDTPSANILAQHIISSADKLFFISKKNGGSVDDICKWRLIRVALSATMSTYPSCLKDGRYAVDFYVTHPSNFRFNKINQRFWIQYHCRDDLLGACSSSDTHLIHPLDTSEDRHKLLPFRCFLNLTHSDTYIHGSFDFATVNGWKSCN